VAGLHQPGPPAWSIGYVYVPALLAIVVGSVAFAPIGARATHRWPVKLLRRTFAFVLYALAGYMIWKAWQTAHI
jgi:uncharacterized protein